MNVIVFLFVFTVLSYGQNQDGSVAIAGAVVPAVEAVQGGYVDCLERSIAVGVPQKDARKDCLKAAEKGKDLGSDGLDDASGAAKASRPRIINPFGGYGGYYGGYRYGAAQMRAADRAVAAQMRAADRAEAARTRAADRQAAAAQRAADREAAAAARREKAEAAEKARKEKEGRGEK